ncbi:MAG: hypothetical protein K2O40_03535, partial [Lachnospiraceae bacterium]|nr:hypothetical protein [Lachnospiraceae bacterium]
MGRIQVQAIKIADIDNHVTALIQENRLSASSIKKVVDVLNAAFHWAIIRGELEFNPTLSDGKLKETIKSYYFSTLPRIDRAV